MMEMEPTSFTWKDLQLEISLFLLLSSFAVVSSTSAESGKSQTQLQPETNNQVRTRGLPQIDVNVGRVTLDVKDKPLFSVLKTIAIKSGIAMRFPSKAKGVLVTKRLANLPLDEALRGLLEEYNHVFLYKSGIPEGRHVLTSIWVLPRDKAYPMSDYQIINREQETTSNHNSRYAPILGADERCLSR